MATEKEQRQRVVQEARRWLGTPYHHCADILGAGVDCAMLLVRVYAACGLIPASIEPRPYVPDWHLHRNDEKYLSWLHQFGHPTTQPQPGDVTIWKFGRCYSHGAIWTGSAEIVHAYLGQGCVLASPLQELLASRPALHFTFWPEQAGA